MTTGAVRWIRHLVSRGTTVEVAAPHDDLAECWEAVVAAARTGRITGVLAGVAVERGDEVGPDRAAEARGHHRSAMTVALDLERELLAATGALRAAGIPHRVLKGSAVAHLDHDDPSDRDFGDVDLLVPSLAAAVAALAPMGCARRLPAAHPRLDEVLNKSVTLVRDGTEIDLHRTLTGGSFGLVLPAGRLFEASETFVVGDVALTALDGPSRLVHTAAHLRLGSPRPRLSTHRDLLVQMDRIGADAAVARADELGLAAVLSAAVAQLGVAGWPAPRPYREWAAAHRPTIRDERRLRAHLAADGDFAALTRTAWPELGWRDRALVARAVTLPGRAHLEARGLTRRAHLRRISSRRRRSSR